MKKLWIKFRKKFLLPPKYKKTKKEMIKNIKIRSNKDIYRKIEEETAELLLAQRLKNENTINLQKGKLEALNWMTHGGTEK